ncbi:MAG: hypothetical protein KIG88_01760 [Weeksellaceae bacterium]|nr:hypothetical protein [Weeksellaceae bacterium]
MNWKLNPEGIKEQYLNCLNECFGHWGDSQLYEWVFYRECGLVKPDLFLLNTSDDDLMAGSALTYRKLAIPGSDPISTGIMTGSWTLPNARGKGCFTEIISYSKKLVLNHKYNFLTAYVTEQNASFRRLRDFGSLLIPTYYIIVDNDLLLINHKTIKEIDINADSIRKCFQLREQNLKNVIHYDYNLCEFESQFIKRSGTKVRIFKIDNEYLITEENNHTVRILWSSSYSVVMIQVLLNWAKLYNKNVFFMSTDSTWKENKDVKIIPGYFTVINSSLREIDIDWNNINIQYGDKM